jgi:hypothetical protein
MVRLHTYIDQSETSGENFHCVELNGFVVSIFEELYITAVTRLPWKQFILSIIGSDEAHLPFLLDDIAGY